QRQQLRADRHLVAGLDVNGFHDAVGLGGYLHRRLVGLDRKQRLTGLHRVAGLDENRRDRPALDALAEVRKFELSRGLWRAGGVSPLILILRAIRGLTP